VYVEVGGGCEMSRNIGLDCNDYRLTSTEEKTKYSSRNHVTVGRLMWGARESVFTVLVDPYTSSCVIKSLGVPYWAFKENH